MPCPWTLRPLECVCVRVYLAFGQTSELTLRHTHNFYKIEKKSTNAFAQLIELKDVFLNKFHDFKKYLQIVGGIIKGMGASDQEKNVTKFHAQLEVLEK